MSGGGDLPMPDKLPIPEMNIPKPIGSGTAPESINPIKVGGGDMKMLQQGGDLGTIAVPAFLVFLNNNVKGKKSRKDLKKRFRSTRRR